MIEAVTMLLIGFSVCSAAVLALAYLAFLPGMQKTVTGRVACTALLGTLAGLQLFHLDYLRHGTALIEQPAYAVLLLMAPPAFYFFSREVLVPEYRQGGFDLVHFAPLALAAVFPPATLAPIAFFIGTGYAFWFTRVVFGLRAQRSRFRVEMFFFSLFAVQAVLVLITGLSLPHIDPGLFYLVYANLIGAALLLVVAALIVFPDLLGDISDAAIAAYASSTLANLDVDALAHELERLMAEEKLYEDESLSLNAVAGALDIGAHQLSELVNTRFDTGFSRYVRQHRVEAAKRLLVAQADASILSVSLSTGFRSQSNFYAAFRELVGQSPGAWRKQALGSAQDS